VKPIQTTTILNFKAHTMKFALVFLAVAALIKSTYAQTSATVLIQDSVHAGSAYGYMSTSFVGLKLPSGGGSATITFTPGDSADGTYVTDYADHSTAGPYTVSDFSTSISIGSTGHYWVYLATFGTTSNVDWLEIRVEASTYQGTVTCTYCSPPTGWGSGWPPVGTHQQTGVVPVASQPGPQNNNMLVPRWVVPVVAVVIAVATLVPISYCLYRRHRDKKSMLSSDGSSMELQSTTVF
jgi:hypothetical protein